MDDRSQAAAVRERALRLFDFLKAIRTLREQPVRDLNRYSDQKWWQDDLPLAPGCALRQEDDETGAWLTVRQQQVPVPPHPPDGLHQWADGPLDDPEAEPGLRTGAEPGATEAERQRRWQAWLEEEWRPWATTALLPHRVQRFYRTLFLLRQRLQREGDTLEFVWGHGMLSWQVGEERIYHPLLLTRLDIDFDPARAIIRLVPGAGPTIMEVEPLDGLDVAGLGAVTSLAAELTTEPVDPWDLSACTRLYRETAHSLSPSGAVLGGERAPAPGEHPTVTHAPVLFVRRRRTGYQRDLQQITDAIRSGRPIPDTIASVVAHNQRPSDAETASWLQAGEELLLPLPTNVEQLEIASRLARHHGVTVQGPPGTGKSHTIANLICHLLAHGKRVLVTSHAERPLQVLRDRIPEAIRPLCVSLMGADADALKLLEQSVQAMAEQLGSLDQGRTRQSIQARRDDLARTRLAIAALRHRLQMVAEREAQTYFLDGQELKPADLARWLAAHEEELSFIPDALSADAQPPLSARELGRLYELVSTLQAEDLARLAQHRPDPSALPAGAQLAGAAEGLERSRQELAGAPAAMRDWTPPTGLLQPVLDDLDRALEKAAEQVQRLEEPWLAAIRHDAARGGLRQRQWLELIDRVASGFEKIIALNNRVAEHQLTLSEAKPLPELLQTLQALRQHLAEGKGLGFFGLIGKSDLKEAVATCRVDGAQVRTPADVDVLIAEVQLRQERQALVTMWNRLVGEVRGPQVDPSLPRPERLVDEGAREIQSALTWEAEVWKPLQERIASLGLPFPVDAAAGAIAQQRRTVHLAARRLEELTHEQTLQALRDELEAGRSRPNASALWDRMYNAMAAMDWAAWDEALGEARRLQALEPLAAECEQLRTRLAEVAPAWAQRIVAAGGDPERCGAPARAPEAWAWRQAETWLDDLLSADPNVLQRDLEAQLIRERELITELAASATWLAQAERVTDEQRRALIGWQQLIQRIGKGTGKYAPRLKREAQLRMQECRGAVPVWIMPLQRVVENFDPLGEPFDVVIVDESSQCDTFALLALFRAKRAVVVGDDNQISPQGVGVDEGQVNRLIDQYLEDVPNAELFGSRQSLYDIATRAFPGVIMLREHFRCLPEIIQFSNDLMYDGRILPLREAADDPAWRPVIAHRVDGVRAPGADINEAEAEALVEAVVDCCHDPAYNGKTMGVISLLGEAQARLIETRLLQRLGPKAVDERRLLCGDAYYFQGDERDVIFLTLVESSGPHRKATLNKLADRQRFNVAASRAKDQLWLFYSVDPGELNPEDVRSRLIRYCERPRRLAPDRVDPVDLCESDFERDVLRALTAKGYSVRPQVRVGHYRIDLVVEGLKARLAVECDGERFHGKDRWEADLQRQLTLERQGWVFFRLRGSDFYRDRDRAMKPLWDRLEQMGITP